MDSSSIEGKTLAEVEPKLLQETLEALRCHAISPNGAWLDEAGAQETASRLLAATIRRRCACGQFDCATFYFWAPGPMDASRSRCIRFYADEGEFGIDLDEYGNVTGLERLYGTWPKSTVINGPVGDAVLLSVARRFSPIEMIRVAKLRTLAFALTFMAEALLLYSLFDNAWNAICVFGAILVAALIWHFLRNTISIESIVISVEGMLAYCVTIILVIYVIGGAILIGLSDKSLILGVFSLIAATCVIASYHAIRIQNLGKRGILFSTAGFLFSVLFLVIRHWSRS